MHGWDLALLVIVGYMSGLALVRLMVRRRDQMLEELRRQMDEEERAREAAAKAKAKAQQEARRPRAA